MSLVTTGSDAPPVEVGNPRQLRVAVTTSFGYWGSIGPADLFTPGSTKMLGGGETAMLWLARGLAAAGHIVDFFYDTPRPGRQFGINCYPKSLKAGMLTTTDYDVLISWEDTLEAVAINHRAKSVIYAVQRNDMQIGVLDYGIDAYQAVSQWHIQTLLDSDPSINKESVRSRFFSFPNGVDLQRYSNPPEREPYRVIYSSSPDRGLHHLLGLWPRIRRQVPEATLHVYYDMTNWFQIIRNTDAAGVMTNTTERAHLLQKLMAENEGNGLTVHGGIGQWELAQEQMKSSLCVYPCDPVRPTEGFSCTVLENLAAGTPVVTSNADAFPELWSGKVKMIPLPFEETHDDWLAAIVGLLQPGSEEWLELSERGKKYAAGFDWRMLGRLYTQIVLDIAEKQI